MNKTIELTVYLDQIYTFSTFQITITIIGSKSKNYGKKSKSEKMASS